MGEESWLETMVSGPGVLRFRYYRPTGTYLSFSHWELYGQTANVISLSDNWECCWWPKEIRIPSGVHVLRWRAFTGRTRLDQVSFTPGLPPLITVQPQSRVEPPGGLASFHVVAQGSEPLFYQWFREYEGPIADATNQTYRIDNVSREDDGLGFYAEVWNAYGRVRSHTAGLHVPGPPDVYIGSPTEGEEVASGDVRGYASIYNVSVFGVERIELFDGPTKLAEELDPSAQSFSWTLTNVPPGRSLSLYAVVTDGVGQSATSAVVNVSVSGQPIRSGASWRFLNTGTIPPSGWREIGFDDGQWWPGVAPFAYLADPAKPTAAWFRRKFQVPDPAGLSNVVLWLRRDDGAVAYLNGTEIFRSNMPEGPIEPTTAALATVEGPEETAWFPQRVPANLFMSGTNLLAVEVHQAGPTNNDVAFDLRLNSHLPPHPVVAIVNPEPNEYATFVGSAIPLRAVAVDPDGEITRVEFLGDGIKIGEAVSPPYSMMLSNPPLGWGIWTLTARAIDDSGLIRTSAPVYLRLPVPSTTVFLTSGPWRYLNDGSDPGPNWRAAGFDDATWPSDYTVLGTWPFADTEIDIGPSGARHPTLYFRSLFSVNPIVLPHINRFILGLYRESGDGVVVYLNGLEILRTNLADGPVSSTNYTGLEERDAVWSEVELDGDLLLAQNILAVEMHQNSPNSEQFAFDLELSGHLDATTPLLSVTRSEAGIQLSWERKWYWSESGRTWFVHHGSLEQATEFDGPWSLVEGFPAGAYSASTAAGVPQLFFRLRWP